MKARGKTKIKKLHLEKKKSCAREKRTHDLEGRSNFKKKLPQRAEQIRRHLQEVRALNIAYRKIMCFYG